MDLIKWCNDNEGFLSALLSLFTIILSTVAIAVSIHTAYLPYKKKIKLNSTYDFCIFENQFTGQSKMPLLQMTITATNIGNRIVNIQFIGLAMKQGLTRKSMQKLQNLDDSNKGKMISTGEFVEVNYKTQEILSVLQRLKSWNGIYLYACDTEKAIYTKKIGSVGEIKKVLSNIK